MTVRTALRVVLSAAVLAGLAGVFVPAPVDAQSTAVSYQRLVQREKAARGAASTSIATLRTLAKSYENFTRAHYLSGYADNALWQAAGLYETVYARSKTTRDREEAIRLLRWLKKEYPTGTLAKQADARLRAIASDEAPAVTAAAPPAPPPAAASAPRASEPAPTPAEPDVRANAEPLPAPATAVPAAMPTANGSRRPAASAPAPKVDAAAPPRSAPAAAAPSVGSAAEPAIASVPLAPPKPAPVPTPSMAINVKDISYSSLPKGDRLVLEFTSETAYSSSRTSNPDRVFIDLPGAGVPVALAERAAKISGNLVKTLTVAQNPNGSARLVLQLSGQPRYSTFPLYDPFRLVIDVESDAVAASQSGAPVSRPTSHDAVVLTSARPATPSAAADAVVTNVAPPTTKSGSYSLARQLGLGVSRIVIDPGHGGHDPGASANGVTEASLVLDVALRLETLLSAHEGTDVVLTRRTDAFVPLEERTAIANRESADMFISIHANSSPQKTTSGVETFFLDFASNPHAQSVAARENASSSQNMRVLPELVKTIALNDKLQESSELADAVQASLIKRLRMRAGGSQDHGVKRAPFVVLIGAQMPSVLAEISFLTNRAEASLLKQGAYRQRIAQALADAIVKYQSTLKKVTSVSTARNER